MAAGKLLTPHRASRRARTGYQQFSGRVAQARVAMNRTCDGITAPSRFAFCAKGRTPTASHYLGAGAELAQ